MPNYDLRSEPWIPVTSRAGGREVLGLRELFFRAHELAEVGPDSPLETGALLRLLVAITLRIVPDQAARIAAWKAERFDPDAVNTYFDRWQDRFDLFHPERPFYQDAGFWLKDAASSARLVPQLSSGNNVVLFDHTVDDIAPALRPAEAARALLAHQAYGLGGGQGSTSEAYGKHPNLCHGQAALGVNVFVLGETLLQTLLLNCPDAKETIPGGGGVDVPVWELDSPPRPGTARPAGLLDYLTWPNRCVRLVPEEVNGEVVVRGAHVAQCRVLDREAPVRDPFVPMREGKKDELYSLRISQERALWRDSASLFGAATTPVGQTQRLTARVFDSADRFLQRVGVKPTLRCMAVGMDFEQAKINLWRSETLPLPVELLRDPDAVSTLVGAVRVAEDAGDSLRGALRVLARWLLDPKGGQPDPKAITPMADSFQAEPAFWTRLDGPFRDLITRIEDDPDGANEVWNAAIWRAATDAFDEAERQAGTSARGFHARVEAEGLLHAKIRSLRPKSLPAGDSTQTEETLYGKAA